MKKIDFVNGTTIDGAQTFNDMQNNVEEVFNGEEPMGSIVVEDIKCSNFLDADNPTNSTIKWTGSEETHYFTSEATWKSIEWLLNVKKGEEYTFSYKERNSNNLYLYITELVNNDVVRTIVADGMTTINSFTVENDCILKIEFMNSASVSNVPIEQLMLNRGLKQLPYTPYKKFGYNSQESMGKIVVDDISCKNLINPSTITKYYYLDYSNGNPIWDGAMCYTDFIPVTQWEKYTLSDSIVTLLAIHYYDENKNWIWCDYVNDGVSTSMSKNVGDNSYVRLCFGVSRIDYTQFEKGEKTPYAPHKKFDCTDTGWKDIVYENTYSSYDETGYNKLQYKKINNQVFLRGMVKNSTTPASAYYATVGTLPSEARPKKVCYYLANEGDTPISAFISNDGTIKVMNKQIDMWISLDGISFFVD